jgi:hypothetical protein
MPCVSVGGNLAEASEVGSSLGSWPVTIATDEQEWRWSMQGESRSVRGP